MVIGGPTRIATAAAVLFALGLIASPPAHAQLNPYLSQQARFPNINYDMYPNGYVLSVQPLKEGNLRAGSFLIHPHMGIAETYTDNVSRTNTSQATVLSDWYTTYAPGLQVQLPIQGRHLLIFDYKANIERYNRFHGLNVEDQTYAGNLVLNGPTGLTIKALGEIKSGHDYLGAATSTSTATVNRWYTTSGGTEVEFQRVAYIRARYKAIRWQFIGPLAGTTGDPNTFGDINTRNRLEHYVSLAFGRRIAPKTYLFIEQNFQREIYDINKDLNSFSYGTGLGLKWDITEKTSGGASIGWMRRNVDRASIRTTESGAGTFEGLYFNAGLGWTAPTRTTVSLNAYRSINETVLGGTTFFVSTGMVLNLSQPISNKWNIVGQFIYNHDDYSGPIFSDNKTGTRRDDYITAGAGLTYQIQPWLGARVQYTYTQRESVFGSVDYKASTTMASLQAQF